MILYRKARDGELEIIMDLAIRTFTGEQNIPVEMNYLPSEKEPHWFCAEENNTIIGIVAFFKEKDGWHAGRFALESDARGRHVGTRLISFALNEMFRAGTEEVLMEGRPATVHILTKLGAQITGDAFPFFLSTCTPMRLRREDFQPAPGLPDENSRRM